MTLPFSDGFLLRRLLPAFVIFAVSVVAGYFLGKLLRLVTKRVPHADETVQRLVGRIGSWLLYLFGLLAAVQFWFFMLLWVKKRSSSRRRPSPRAI